MSKNTKTVYLRVDSEVTFTRNANGTTMVKPVFHVTEVDKKDSDR